jgi:DNA-binding NarL/FixJ family response regulator
VLPPPLRVLHCDDSSSYRLLVEDWFEDYDDVRLVHSTSSVEDAVTHARSLRPDVVVTDTFGSLSAVAVIRRLHEAAPTACVLLLTGYLQRQLHREVVASVDCVITKGIDEEELIAALRSLARPAS